MYFLDTNVPIGYTIIHDRWHENSKNFIDNNKNSIFWSNFVKSEYYNKLDNILDYIVKFLKSIVCILKVNEMDFYSYNSFEEHILNETRFCKLDYFKKQKILENFWNEYDFIVGISTKLYDCFYNYAFDFVNNYNNRDLRLNEIMRLHDCGLDNYLKYYDYALKLYKNGIHPPDCKIIIDAHDCGLTHDDLKFISNDNKLIDALSKIDTSNLRIIEFGLCNS